jgi:acetyl-CoA carboxylase carboxyltransferase component
MESKLFDVRWGAGYAHPDNKTVNIEEITEENGWDIYNIEKIDALRIGQGVDCSDIGGEVFVNRIK